MTVISIGYPAYFKTFSVKFCFVSAERQYLVALIVSGPEGSIVFFFFGVYCSYYSKTHHYVFPDNISRYKTCKEHFGNTVCFKLLSRLQIRVLIDLYKRGV